MSGIKLYYMELSPSSRSVLLLIKYLKLDVELIAMSTFAGDTLKPEFLKINPQHCVPTLDDNGEIIWDSHAICTYLGSKYSKTLCPSDNPYIRSRIDQRMHYHHGTLFGRYCNAIVPIFYDGSVDLMNEKKIQSIHQALEFLEIFVTESDYLVGDALTVADLLVLTTTRTIFDIFVLDSSKYVKIHEWLERVRMQLPSFDEIEVYGTAKMHEKLMLYLEKNKANV